jgi:hypothetical protein
MLTWAERAKNEILKTMGVPTDKTDKTPVLGHSSVLAVPTPAAMATTAGLSSVLSVPPPAVFEKYDFDNGPVLDPFDTRVTCSACRFLWPGNRCLMHRRAGLTTRDLAAEFTLLRQHCPGWAPSAAPRLP